MHLRAAHHCAEAMEEWAKPDVGLAATPHGLIEPGTNLFRCFDEQGSIYGY